jgi:pimeloyl-ACP methyl ester carboxylesterase
MAMLVRFALGMLVFVGLTVTVGSLLISVRPLSGLMPPEKLADPDSRFMDLNGLKTHYKTAGGGETLILLLHGFSSSTFSWRDVLQPLAAFGTVVAYDRPGFGLTERPLGDELRNWPGANPYGPDAQADQVAALIEALGFEKAILVGNSAGGTIAMHAYLRHPERVQGIIFVDPAIYRGGGAQGWLRPLLGIRPLGRLGQLISRSLAAQGDRLIKLAWHDPAKVTPAVLAGYRKPLQVENWDRALWEFTLAGRDLKLGERVKDMKVPVLVITGDDDRIVPTADSIRLASELPNAELVVIPSCGHLPQEECPWPFLEAATRFMSQQRSTDASSQAEGTIEWTGLH